MSFRALKQSRTSAMERINSEIAKMNNSAFTSQRDDERFWYPDVDKAGNGSAVIRFLPETNPDESIPFVRVFTHSFKGPTGKWYIESCPTTLGHKCPVCEANSELWNSGVESNKDIVRGRKRQVAYISNIYVISDPANPENNGKVKLFKYGKKIYNMINSAMNPEFDDIAPMNPFDLWEGATFRIRIRKVDGYRNYDRSSFDTPAPLFDNDDEMEAVFNQQFVLEELIAPDKFKEYDVLKRHLDNVIGKADNSDIVQAATASSSVDDGDLDSKVDEALAKASEVEDEDDPYARFRNMALGE